MFTKYDKWFEQAATEPARRRAAIADFSKRRNILFWCAMVITLCALLSAFASDMAGKSGGFALLFSAAVIWSIVFKFESELRLLQVIEKLLGKSDEKPLA